MYREAVCKNQLHTKQPLKAPRVISVLSSCEVYASICQHDFLQVVNIKALQKMGEGTKLLRYPTEISAKLYYLSKFKMHIPF